MPSGLLYGAMEEPGLLPPDVLGDLLHDLELGPLTVFLRRAEAATRTDSHALDGEELRSLLDALLQVVLSLGLAVVADEAEHANLVAIQEAQSIEGAGELAVILEQVTVELQLAEQLLGDVVVAALPVPASATATARVASTHMHAERDAREAGDYGVVGANRALQIGHRVLAARLHGLDQ